MRAPWRRRVTDGERPTELIDPVAEFQADHYLRHNQRRLEHLATLGLPLAGRSVIEVGAGIGDHTSFFLDRECSVLSTEGRPENYAVLRERYPYIDVRRLDLDDPDSGFKEQADIVYCYGTLYHLERPAEAIAFMSGCCRSLLLVETCVSPGDDKRLNKVREQTGHPSQALTGTGCRPTRPWVYAELEKHFANIYLPLTQPWHPEFPVDWTLPVGPDQLVRAIFVASREQLQNPLLSQEIPTIQIRG